MVGSLGVIRAKEEPAASSSTASQSPPRSGSLLAGRGALKTSAHPFICTGASELWGTTEIRDRRKIMWELPKKIMKQEERKMKVGGRGQSWRKCNKAGVRMWRPASLPLGCQMEESQCVLKYSCVLSSRPCLMCTSVPKRPGLRMSIHFISNYSLSFGRTLIQFTLSSASHFYQDPHWLQRRRGSCWDPKSFTLWPFIIQDTPNTPHICCKKT